MRMRTWIAVLGIAGVLVACGGPSGEEGSSGTPAEADAPRGAVAEADTCIGEQAIDRTKPRWKLSLTKPPKFAFDAEDTYYWVLKTNQGTMKFRLLPAVAPMHVSSTIYLTRLGFYDDIPFHRVIQDFMAQGGDPLGRGSGGPGYQYGGEFSREVRHDKGGLLSMANSGPGTDGSQFFITFKATPWLDDKHTIFGEIVEGEDIIQRLNALGQPGRSPSHAPKEPVVIEKATIVVE